MYKFIENVDAKAHDTFIYNHPLCNLLQTSSWAKIKENWDHQIVGACDENGELVASSLVLIKRLPMKMTMMYIPRGPIMDYTNKELIQFYLKSLKKWAKKYHCLFIKIDPAIHLRDFSLDEKDTPMNQEAKQCIDNIIASGAKHMGYTQYIAQTIQPRFHMGVAKCDDLDHYIPRATLRSKNVAIRKHVVVEEVGKEGLEEFAKVMSMTEKRKGVHLRDLEYFQLLMDTYPDNAHLFLAKVNPSIRKNELDEIINNAKEALEDPDIGRKQRNKLNEELKHAQDELNSMQEVLEKYHDEEVVIAGGLMIGYGKVMEMLYAGMDDDFRTFRPQYLTYLTQFQYAFDHDYDYVTMGGVEGDLKDGLAMYKSAFNPTVNEFVGEFDIPVNGLLYQLSELAYKIRKSKNKHKK